MINRIYDGDKVRDALDLYPYGDIALDTKVWVSDDRNLAFESDDGSIALFEYISPGLYDGHYFFLCRGKKAIGLAKDVIDLVYHNYGVKAIRGFTPIEHKAALWMSRHLGFENMGVVDTDNGECVLFVMNLDKHKGTK